jgi:hypothetical protein
LSATERVRGAGSDTARDGSDGRRVGGIGAWRRRINLRDLAVVGCENLAVRQYEEIIIEGLNTACEVHGRRRLIIAVRASKFKKEGRQRARIAVARTCCKQYVPVWKHRRRSIGESTTCCPACPAQCRYVGTLDPGVVGRSVDCGWICGGGGAAGVATECDNSAVGTCHRGPYLMIAASRRIDKRHRRRGNAGPQTRSRVVLLGVGGIPDINRQDLAGRQERIALFILVCAAPARYAGIGGRAGAGPPQSRGIEKYVDRWEGAGSAEHKCAAGQHDACVANATIAVTRGGINPARAARWRYRCPCIGDRIVDRTQTGPNRRCATSVVAGRSAIIVFTAFDDDATIRQHRGSKSVRIIPARQRGNLLPGAVDVAASNVRGQLIPGAGTGSMRNDCAIREQQWIGEPGGRCCRRLPVGRRTRLRRFPQRSCRPPGQLRQELIPGRWIVLEESPFCYRQSRHDWILRLCAPLGYRHEHGSHGSTERDNRSQVAEIGFA